jgi:hypothetical protein
LGKDEQGNRSWGSTREGLDDAIFGGIPMARRAPQGPCDPEDNNLEGKAVANAYRKHPLSIAISMALLATASSSAMALEQTSAPAENTAAPDRAQDEGPTPPLPDTKKAKSGTGGTASDAGAKGADDLEEITVVGIRYSQIRSIELKRAAASIQDSISAESIGQLPDVTITDALQRRANQPRRGRWNLGRRARPAPSGHHAER